MLHLKRGKRTSERGQSIAEVMISLPFMFAIVVGLIEMGIVFAAYLSQVNAAREGAIFATMYPQLADTSCGSIPYPDCTGSIDTNTYAGTTDYWDEYYNRVSNELFLNIGEPLRRSQLLSEDTLTVDRPMLGPVTSDCPTGYEIACPITITVHFRLHTLTSGAQVPYFGRFGLPNYYQIDYSFGMPIR